MKQRVISLVIGMMLLASIAQAQSVFIPDGSRNTLPALDRLTDKIRIRVAGLLKGVPCATHSCTYYDGLSNGTDLITSYRTQHTCPHYTSGLQLTYGNYQVTSSNTEPGTGNSITVTAAVEIGSASYQCTWNGATSVVIASGQTAPPTDPLPVDIVAGGTFYERACATVGSAGMKWPLAEIAYSTDSHTVGSDVTTSTGAMSSTSSVFQYGACAITGQVYPVNTASVLLVGDSITAGTGDTPGDMGWAVRGLNGNYGYIQEARSSSQLQQWNQPGNILQRQKLASCADNAVIMLGTNDTSIASVSLMESCYTTILNYYLSRGEVVFVATIPPKTTSTDGWTTTTNQTALTTTDAVDVTYNTPELRRVALNTFIRGLPATYPGKVVLVETADVCETSRNSGIWKAPTTVLVTSILTGATSGNFTDTTQTFTSADIGQTIYITSGTGAGQTRLITSASGTSCSTNPSWTTTPDTTSHYTISDVRTPDGTHPSTVSAKLMGAILPTAQFVN